MKVLLRINQELSIIAGKILKIKDCGSRYYILLQYYEGNKKYMTLMNTTVVFVNQNLEDENNKKQYADWVREKNLTPGMSVIVFVRFPTEDHIMANGYGIKTEGVMKINPSEDIENELNIVAGLILWMKFVKNRNNVSCLSIGIYLGTDKYGNSSNAIIYIQNKDLANRCFKDFRQNTGAKIYAAFCCGEGYLYTDKFNRKIMKYHGSDYTVMRILRKQEGKN